MARRHRSTDKLGQMRYLTRVNTPVPTLLVQFGGRRIGFDDARGFAGANTGALLAAMKWLG
jgi:hypothetical protein